MLKLLNNKLGSGADEFVDSNLSFQGCFQKCALRVDEKAGMELAEKRNNWFTLISREVLNQTY